MFTSKSLFSEIACPYQQNCILPGCIFGHPKETKTSYTPPGSPERALHLGGDQDVQRKCRKVADDYETPTDPPKPGKLEHLQSSPRSGLKTSSTSNTRPGERIFTTDREISPPPLRRKVQNGTPLPVKQPLHNGSSSKSYASVAPSTTTTERKSPAKVAPKKEPLNPRALKGGSAPATHNIRLKLLQALHEHFKRLNSELASDANEEEEKLVLSDQELITMSLDIEEGATATPSIYSNVVKNKILAYKRMTVPQWKEEREREVKRVQAAEKTALVSDTPVAKLAESPKRIETGLTCEEELKLLHRLHTPVAGLANHGYVTSIPSDEEIEAAKKGVEAAKGFEVCDRCKSRFQVFPGRREEDGALASGGTCTYHYGKPYWQDRSAADPKAKREKKYRCCHQSLGDSAGCTQAENHVFKITEVKRMAAVLNFEKTPDNWEKSSNSAVCTDAEMGYTVYGLELIRLTATSWPSGRELFDVLVRPMGEVLDLNSRYSGVWPNDMANAVPWDAAPEGEIEAGTKRKLRIVGSPTAARALLFSHLSPETPLIGHGLENDLNATRIIHPTIVDTALLFPHKAGLPYRNGLKALMHTHLNRHIQVVIDGRMEGHDSKEDANAAGDLVRYALGNEWRKLQREGWRLEKGEFIEPPPSQTPPPAPPKAQPPRHAPTGPSGRKRSRGEMEMEDGEMNY